MSQTEADKKFELLLNDCDLLIKAGKISAVAALVSKLNLAQVPRGYRQGLAKICRRAGLVSHGLRLLQPLVRQVMASIESPVQDGEICEYAVLLSRNGSIQEALDLLSNVDSQKNPEASLYLGYCHISNWNYSEAVSYLETFLQSTADNYSKLIAKVNLAASYVAVFKLEQAERLLNEIIAEAESSGASRLVGNGLHLRGQMHFRKQDFTSSRKDFANAQKIFGSGQSYDQLLIKKWQTIMTALESGSIKPLLEFREEAVKRKHWESVREADLFTVKVQFQQSLLDKLMVGTPMQAYRERILQEINAPPSDHYLYGEKQSLTLDLQSGSLSNSTKLDPGRKIHQVLASLVRDLYVPRNMGTLFSELYPDEYFDVNSSGLRVRQLLKRTRLWLRDSEIPASIQQFEGTYRLLIDGAFGIQIPLENRPMDPNLVRWGHLHEAFAAGAEFTAEEACQSLKWSRSTFLRLSEWATAQGLLLKTGINKATRYRVEPRASGAVVKNVA